jgi:predicted SnoaL-like aldol condensation-catalyzing enzyme
MAPTVQATAPAGIADGSVDASAAERLLENKQTVREFYDLAFARRSPNDAAARCVALPRMAFSPRLDSAQAHVASVVGWLDSMPRLKVDVLRLVAEGDLVVVQSSFTPAPGERAMLVMDMFRLRGGRIVEHWDALQEVQDLSRQAPLEV